MHVLVSFCCCWWWFVEQTHTGSMHAHAHAQCFTLCIANKVCLKSLLYRSPTPALFCWRLMLSASACEREKACASNWGEKKKGELINGHVLNRLCLSISHHVPENLKTTPIFNQCTRVSDNNTLAYNSLKVRFLLMTAWQVIVITCSRGVSTTHKCACLKSTLLVQLQADCMIHACYMHAASWPWPEIRVSTHTCGHRPWKTVLYPPIFSSPFGFWGKTTILLWDTLAIVPQTYPWSNPFWWYCCHGNPSHCFLANICCDMPLSMPTKFFSKICYQDILPTTMIYTSGGND